MKHPSKIKTRSETALALLLWCAAAGVWIGRPVLRLRPVSTAANFSPIPTFEITSIPTAASLRPKGRSIRRVYGHSLVAGGIHSIEELMAVIAKDPRLAEHYRNFDLSKAHIVTLDHNLVAYVSYRLAKGIYWEAKPSIIAKGEQVITDGTNFIRVRCGNRISYAPGFPIHPGEPEDMDIVVALTRFDPPVEPTAIPPIADLPLTPRHLPAVRPPEPPPGFWLPPCCTGGGRPPIPPSVRADEFSTIFVAIFGHAYGLPSAGLALLAGILLVIALRFSIWR